MGKKPTGWSVLKDGKQVAPVVFSAEEPAWTWLLHHQSKAPSSAVQQEGYSIAQVEREHSPRATQATDRVRLWLANDRVLTGMAQAALEARGEYGLWRFVIGQLERSKPHSPAWQVAQELEPDDYSLIRWDDVADRMEG